MDHLPFRTLSKTDFKAACECPAKLYYREMNYPTTDADDPYLQMLAVGGYMVETVAKLMFPGGIPLEYAGSSRENANATRTALEAEKVTLFEATLLSGRKLARTDILEKDGNTFRLIEVKAKLFDTAENAKRLHEGKSNCFRGVEKPFPISTNWMPYIQDVAYQMLVLQEMFPDAKIEPYLCLVDKSKRTTIDGLTKYFRIERRPNRMGLPSVHRAYYDGDVEKLRADNLVTIVDVSAEVEEIMGDVRTEADRFERSLLPELTKLEAQPNLVCAKCEYRLTADEKPSGFAECWGAKASVRPSVLDLYHASGVTGLNGPLVNELIIAGKVSLLDIAEEQCARADGEVGPVATRQRIQLSNTRANTTWRGDTLKAALESVQYPLHFIDFEAARLALPPHAGMRPYGQLAFQWSCHTLASPGAELRHAEWLNDRDYWPNADFARSLKMQIGDTGTVLTWSQFERSTLVEVARELTVFGQEDKDLSDWINALRNDTRILDLNKVALDGYFTPGMGGRTSIKVVLDAIWKADTEMRARFEEIMKMPADAESDPYSSLPALVINGVEQNVAEGTGAIRAYEAMMYGVEREDSACRAAWRELLLNYCKLDTLAMVLIWEHWERDTGVGR
ncbi:MAG: DUF2779 domain-containing protein [Gemmatimonadaceae bacterium]